MSIANSNVIAKVAAVVAGLGLVFSSFAYAVPAKAATTAELEAQVAALLAQIKALQGGSTTVSTGAAFTMDMTLGASGAEVTRLQNWLISKGYSIPAGATGYFGAQTAAAVGAYQSANGISPAAGYFGPMTRAKVNASLGGSTGGDNDDDSDDDSGDLQGGAGSVDSYTLIANLSNEEVGEDEEDVEVAGLEIEVDDGSDIELSAIRLVFNEGTAASDFEDYAQEVSIWLDGEEVARVDGDEFNDDNDWTKTVSLDSGAVIDAGDTGELVVAISGIGNLDSADATDTWTIDFTSVRFRDADGATISEDPATATRTFSFETFANSADAELKVSLTEDAEDINVAHVINVHATDDTDGVEVLAFTLEAEGDSDLEIKDLPVLFTSVEATGNDPDDLAISAYLFADGELVGSENFVTTDTDDSSETITFDDIDVMIDAGEKMEFTVEVDFHSIADVLDAGDTLKAEITSTQRAAIDVEDESGEDLVSGDRTGTALGEAHEVRDVGIMVDFVSADATVSYTGDVANTNDHDRGTFTLVFDVTAFDSDVYIDGTAIAALDGGTGTYQDLSLDSGSGTVTGTVSTSVTASANTTYKVAEDQTKRFTITAVAVPTADGFFSVQLDSVLYALTAIDGDLTHTFGLDDFVTPQVYLNYDA